MRPSIQERRRSKRQRRKSLAPRLGELSKVAQSYKSDSRTFKDDWDKYLNSGMNKDEYNGFLLKKMNKFKNYDAILSSLAIIALLISDVEVFFYKREMLVQVKGTKEGANGQPVETSYSQMRGDQENNLCMALRGVITVLCIVSGKLTYFGVLSF